MPDLLVALLAAGASRRLGQPKQLVEINGEPLLRRQCRVALDARLGPVAVVLGHEVDLIASTLAGMPVQICRNPDWQEGIASSVRTAVHAAREREASGVLLVQADQYRITAEDLQTITGAWEQGGGIKACRACFGDYLGPPVILTKTLFDDALRLTGDEGARKLLARLDRDLLIDVETPNASYDLDTPDHLLTARGAL
jgi:CTP:molybdopterin cytidylyltransferase MocA